MIKDKILASLNHKNFFSEPFPHFRIYDVLDPEMHRDLFLTYSDIHTTQPYGVWDKDMPCDPLWNTELCELWDSANDISNACKKFLCLPDTQFETLAVNVPHHTGSQSNAIIKDWHLDGSDKLLNMIYYLGTGTEKYGAIELRNANTKKEKSYPYCANSMIIWANVDPCLHRFRMTDTLHRYTVYVNYVPKNN